MKINTRSLIMENTINLMWYNGYHGTSIFAISQACKIQKSSFYTHFSSKESLLIHIIDDCHQKMRKDFVASAFEVPKLPALVRKQSIDALKYFVMSNRQLPAIFFISTETEKNIAAASRPIKNLLKDLSKILSCISQNVASISGDHENLGKLMGACMLSRLYHDATMIDDMCSSL
jgi:AcrR family transcriptional regulator